MLFILVLCATVDADVESCSVNLSSSMASAPVSEPGGVACEGALEIGSVSCNINIERIDVDVAAVVAHNHTHTCTRSLSLLLSIFAYLSLARTDAVVESGFQSAFVKLKELCC